MTTKNANVTRAAKSAVATGISDILAGNATAESVLADVAVAAAITPTDEAAKAEKVAAAKAGMAKAAKVASKIDATPAMKPVAKAKAASVAKDPNVPRICHAPDCNEVIVTKSANLCPTHQAAWRKGEFRLSGKAPKVTAKAPQTVKVPAKAAPASKVTPIKRTPAKAAPVARVQKAAVAVPTVRSTTTK